MEEKKWLRKTVDFLVNLNLIKDDERLDTSLNKALSFLQLHSESKQVFLIEKLDNLTAKVIFVAPINSVYESFDPGFFNSIEESGVDFDIKYNFSHLEGIIDKNSSVVILPFQQDNKWQCVLLAYDKDFKFTNEIKQFLEVSLKRIKELIRLATTYNTLESLEVRFNAILQTVPQSIVFIENTGQNSWINEPASKLFNLSAGNVEPSLLSSAMYTLRNSAYNREEIFTTAKKMFHSEDKKMTDWKWVFSDPKMLVLNVYCTPVTSRNISGMLWMFDDVTNQYLYDKQLTELNEQLKESNQYKSQFLANMSHELRTPLNSILILAGLLSENISNNLTPRQVESVKIINKSGVELLMLIDDVLDLSKIEAGKMDLVIEQEPLETIVKDIEELFYVVSQNKDINFNIVIENDVPHIIYTDSQRLKQILKNLLSNAFKFTPEKGSVKLHIQVNPNDEKQLEIAVTDTGIGVAEEKKQQIFEAFKQANGGTSRKYGGTGLGLSISKELIHKFGGDIKLESKLGAGSTFSFILPVYKPEANEVVKGHLETEHAARIV